MEVVDITACTNIPLTKLSSHLHLGGLSLKVHHGTLYVLHLHLFVHGSHHFGSGAHSMSHLGLALHCLRVCDGGLQIATP